MNDNLSKVKKGRNVAFAAFVVTILLASVKLLVGIVYNSQVLVVDAIHSFADSAAVIASAAGLYLAGKSRSKRFPYGLYRAETIAALLIGIFIIYAGIDMGLGGFKQLFIHKIPEKTIPVIPAFTAVLSIILAAGIAIIELKVAREIHSMSLEANAKESFLDVISSLVVLSGILLPVFGVPYMEGGAILVISLFIIKIGIENVYRSILVLLDANMDPELQQLIQDDTMRIKGVKKVKDVAIREAGPFNMVDISVMTAPSATVYAAQDIADRVRDNIIHRFNMVEHVYVTVEPAKNDIFRAVVPVSTVDGLNSRIFHHFGRAPYFAIITIYKDDIVIEDFYLNEFIKKEKHVGLNVVKVLIHYNVDIIFTSKIGEISFYIARDNMIDVYQIEEEEQTIKDIIDAFSGNVLKKITVPTKSS